jgi:riboflavin transporter FmnP
MRRGMLRVAEIFAWTAGALSFFLAFRMVMIFLSIINPAYCDISCDLGRSAVPVSLAVFVVGWAPLLIIVRIHHARRYVATAWVPFYLGVTLLFVLAMSYIALLALSFRDVDGRNVVLASSAAVTLTLATIFLTLGVVLDHTVEAARRPMEFFREDAGE